MAKDALRCVAASVLGVTTGQALELRLGQAVFFDVTAAAAGLATAISMTPGQAALYSSIDRAIDQPLRRMAQARLGLDVAPGPVDRASRRPGHVL